MKKLIGALIYTLVLGGCVPGGGSPSASSPREEVSTARSVAQDAHGTGMLILGSNKPATLAQRVQLGYELYGSGVSFDYIIVSGGCGAHGSNICEATEMAKLLTEKGVPAAAIYKEENSKSTVQNYCFSRMLRKDDGTKLIRPGDSLYVVSNHWHAIPVAGRFKKYDGVNAVYYIRGSILPSKTDKVDYTHIYDNGLNSEEFCE